MSLQEINELTIQDVQEILESRLGLKVDEEADLSSFEAELQLYKAELIEAEEARLAEIARVQNLKDRFEALSDKGLIQAQGIQNPSLHFNKVILTAEPSEAESLLSAIETAYTAAILAMQSSEWLDTRKVEYAKIDSLLLEALAEQVEGRPEKLAEYLALREQIKLANLKPE